MLQYRIVEKTVSWMQFRHPAAWKLVCRANVLLYRMTGGLMGGRMRGNPILLLITTGRKSKKRRTTALTYLVEGDNLVLVASNSGYDRHPAWWLNLKSNSQATVQMGRLKKAVRAKEARGEERSRLWARVTEMNPRYETYQERTKREIPVVILRLVEQPRARP